MNNANGGMIFVCRYCMALLLAIKILSCAGTDHTPIILEPVPLEWQHILEGGDNATNRTYFQVVKPTPIESSCENSTYCWNKISFDIWSHDIIQFVFRTSDANKEMKLSSIVDLPLIFHFKMKSYSCPTLYNVTQIIFSANIAVQAQGSYHDPLLSSLDSIKSFIEFQRHCAVESQLQFDPTDNTASVAQLDWHSSYSNQYLAEGTLPYTLHLEDLYIQGLDWHRQTVDPPTPTPTQAPTMPATPMKTSKASTLQTNSKHQWILAGFFFIYLTI